MLSNQQAKQLVRRTIGEPYVGKRLKQIRIGKVLDRLGLRPARILDAGSGDAAFVYWLADRYPGASVTAVDIDEDAIAACLSARPRAYASRVTFETATFEQLPREAFDLITAFDVFEHIEEDRAAVRSLARALRPGATLLAHVPRDRWRTWNGEVKEVSEHEARRVNPGHVRHGYSPEGLRGLLESAGLVVVDLQTWVGKWGVLAHAVYERLEHPAVLRILSLPVTVAAAHVESRSQTPSGNTVFARATKPG